MEGMVMTKTATGQTYVVGNSVWVPVSSEQSGVVGYIEKFRDKSNRTYTVPGASRWIEGAEFDLDKAVLTE
jgi:hypothetical protein